MEGASAAEESAAGEEIGGNGATEEESPSMDAKISRIGTLLLVALEIAEETGFAAGRGLGRDGGGEEGGTRVELGRTEVNLRPDGTRSGEEGVI